MRLRNFILNSICEIWVSIDELFSACRDSSGFRNDPHIILPSSNHDHDMENPHNFRHFLHCYHRRIRVSLFNFSSLQIWPRRISFSSLCNSSNHYNVCLEQCVPREVLLWAWAQSFFQQVKGNTLWHKVLSYTKACLVLLRTCSWHPTNLQTLCSKCACVALSLHFCLHQDTTYKQGSCWRAFPFSSNRA